MDLAHVLRLYAVAAQRPTRRKSAREQRQAWAAALVSGLHEGQLKLRDALSRKVPRIVNQANRRAGKSEGWARILAEQAILQDGFVVHVLATHLEGPSAAWLEREGDRGLLGMLDQIGAPYHRTAIGGTAKGTRKITFPWGSSLVVHDVANMASIDKHRGLRGHVFWVDEAQNLANLATIIDDLVAAAGADFSASVILSGTPGRELSTLFHRASVGNDLGYERIVFYCWDNPLFDDGNDSTPGQRWRKYLARVGIEQDRVRLGVDDITWSTLHDLEADDLRALALKDPSDLPEHLWALLKALPQNWQREHLGRWVEDGADLVYPTTGMAIEAIYWANDAAALPGDKLPGLITVGDLANRVLSLPADQVHPELLIRREWRVAVGFDLGFQPDPFAWWAGAWCEEDPAMFEVWSGHEYQLMDSAMLERVSSVLDGLRNAGLWIAAALVDAMGQRKGTHVDWSWKLASRFPEGAQGVIAPYKANEALQVKAVNIDVQRGQLKALRGSMADIEARHLQYKPFDPAKPKNREVHKYRKVYLADGKEYVPGDHCSDCRRYVVWWVNNQGRAIKKPQPTKGVPITRANQIAALAEAMKSQR
jgi:hypothetical protein